MSSQSGAQGSPIKRRLLPALIAGGIAGGAVIALPYGSTSVSAGPEPSDQSELNSDLPPSAVDNTKRNAPDPRSRVDLLATGKAGGHSLRLVGFRTSDGNSCIGWANDRIGLPNLCTPPGGAVAEFEELATAATVPATAQQESIRVVWGVAPTGTTDVEVVAGRGSEGSAHAFNGGSRYQKRSYYLLSIATASDGPLTVISRDKDGRELSRTQAR